MNKITKIVLQVLTEHDLEGIIYGDVNLDEYMVEAEPIAIFIMNNCSKLTSMTLADNIQYVFLRYFGDVIPYSECLDTANDMLFKLELNKIL